MIDPVLVTGFGRTLAVSETLSCYRFALPGAHRRAWRTLARDLEVDPDLLKRYLSKLDDDPVRVAPNSLEPGATVSAPPRKNGQLRASTLRPPWRAAARAAKGG